MNLWSFRSQYLKQTLKSKDSYIIDVGSKLPPAPYILSKVF
nr:MAG TPA: hypothetical protein [Caudoviricetes sp.]